MERRFDWISAGDVGIKQDLLNHLRLMERDIAVASARHHLPVLMQHLQSDIGARTSRAVHLLKVGRHELELILERGVEGVEETKPSQTLSLPGPAASLSESAAVAPWKLGRWPLALAVLFAVILLMLAGV
jgi:hypothetical protein